jgi:hypothetical protein
MQEHLVIEERVVWFADGRRIGTATRQNRQTQKSRVSFGCGDGFRLGCQALKVEAKTRLKGDVDLIV